MFISFIFILFEKHLTATLGSGQCRCQVMGHHLLSSRTWPGRKLEGSAEAGLERRHSDTEIRTLQGGGLTAVPNACPLWAFSPAKRRWQQQLLRAAVMNWDVGRWNKTTRSARTTLMYPLLSFPWSSQASSVIFVKAPQPWLSKPPPQWFSED